MRMEGSRFVRILIMLVIVVLIAFIGFPYMSGERESEVINPLRDELMVDEAMLLPNLTFRLNRSEPVPLPQNITLEGILAQAREEKLAVRIALIDLNTADPVAGVAVAKVSELPKEQQRKGLDGESYAVTRSCPDGECPQVGVSDEFIVQVQLHDLDSGEQEGEPILTVLIPASQSQGEKEPMQASVAARKQAAERIKDKQKKGTATTFTIGDQRGGTTAMQLSAAEIESSGEELLTSTETDGGVEPTNWVPEEQGSYESVETPCDRGPGRVRFSQVEGCNGNRIQAIGDSLGILTLMNNSQEDDSTDYGYGPYWKSAYHSDIDLATLILREGDGTRLALIAASSLTLPTYMKGSGDTVYVVQRYPEEDSSFIVKKQGNNTIERWWAGGNYWIYQAGSGGSYYLTELHGLLGSTAVVRNSLNSNLITAINSDGQSVTFSYNAQGRVTSYSDSHGQMQSISYAEDSHGLLNKFTNHDGRSWELSYDENGRLREMIAPNLVKQRMFFDQDGVLRFFNLEYEEEREPTEFRYARNLVGVFSEFQRQLLIFNDQGELIGQEAPLTSVRFERDVKQRITKVLDNSTGWATSYHYNSAGYVEQVLLPLGDQLAYSGHDIFGNPAEVSRNGDPNLTYSYSYDSYGLVTTATNPGIDGGAPLVVQYTRSLTPNHKLAQEGQSVAGVMVSKLIYENGRVVSSSRADGSDSSYSYDANGYLETVNSNGRQTALNFSPAGFLESVVGPGSSSTFTYNTIGQLTKQVDEFQPPQPRARMNLDALLRASSLWSGEEPQSGMEHLAGGAVASRTTDLIYNPETAQWKETNSTATLPGGGQSTRHDGEGSSTEINPINPKEAVPEDCREELAGVLFLVGFSTVAETISIDCSNCDACDGEKCPEGHEPLCQCNDEEV